MSEVSDKLAHLDLTVYSADWCPDCTRLKSWLDQNDVEYSNIGIDDDAAAAEKLESETGKRAIPFILVDGKTWVRGYHKESPRRFEPDVLVSELLAVRAG